MCLQCCFTPKVTFWANVPKPPKRSVYSHTVSPLIYLRTHAQFKPPPPVYFLNRHSAYHQRDSSNKQSNLEASLEDLKSSGPWSLPRDLLGSSWREDDGRILYRSWERVYTMSRRCLEEIAKKRLDDSSKEIHIGFLAEGITEEAVRSPIF